MEKLLRNETWEVCLKALVEIPQTDSDIEGTSSSLKINTHPSCLASPMWKGGKTTAIKAQRETLLRAKQNPFPGARSSGLLPNTPSAHYLNEKCKGSSLPQRMCYLLLPSNPGRIFTALKVKSELPDTRDLAPPDRSPDSPLFSRLP